MNVFPSSLLLWNFLKRDNISKQRISCRHRNAHTSAKVKMHMHNKKLRYFLKHPTNHDSLKRNIPIWRNHVLSRFTWQRSFTHPWRDVTLAISLRISRARNTTCLRINKWNRALSLRFDWIAHDHIRGTLREDVIKHWVYRGETYHRVHPSTRHTRPNSNRQCNETRALVAWPGRPIFFVRISHG